MLTSCMAGWQCSSRHHNKDQESNGHGHPCVAQVDWCHEEKGQLTCVCLSSLCCSGVLLHCQELLWFVFIEAQSYLGDVAHMVSCIYYLHYFLINPKKLFINSGAIISLCFVFIERLFSVNFKIVISQSRHNHICIFCICLETYSQAILK